MKEHVTIQCLSCGEEESGGSCPSSKRDCSHHCNHAWTQDQCCWCGAEFGEETEMAQKYVIVAEGEGAGIALTNGSYLKRDFHSILCVCNQPWHKCETPDTQELIKSTEDKENNWVNDESGKPFSFEWKHENGRVSIFRFDGEKI